MSPGRAVLTAIVAYNADPTKTPLPHSFVVRRAARGGSSAVALRQPAWPEPLASPAPRCGTRFLVIVVGIRLRNGRPFVAVPFFVRRQVHRQIDRQTAHHHP